MTATTPPDGSSSATPAPSSPEVVTEALLALGRDPSHPFIVAVEGGRIVATWVYRDDVGALGASRMDYRLRITLLPETHEYKRSEIKTERSAGNVSGSWSFNSAKVVGPVKQTLEAHGWQRRRSALGKAIRGLFS
jgi:hypothetical protein